MLTHIDKDNRPQMVDVSDKEITAREAVARGSVRIGKEIMLELVSGDIQTKKGPVFATAIIAATMAVKKTHELIPFCHPLILEKINVVITPIDSERLEITCQVSCTGKTGVEMEALTGVHVAALTIHDMCKAMSPDITVENVSLLKKTGGKKDFIKTETKELYGLVLAGGKSSRMGHDKALINYHGAPHAKHLLNTLDGMGIKSFISCREDQQKRNGLEGLPMITDRFLDFGPLGGILSAMAQYPDKAWLVIACDLPYVSTTSIEALISERDASKEATAFYNIERKQFEPLFAVYEPNIYKRMLQYLGEGFTCPQKVLFNSPIKKLTLKNQGFLQNINTPEERLRVNI